MKSLPNELISIILQKIRIPILKIIAEKNRKIRDIATYDKIAINYNVETECLIKFLLEYPGQSGTPDVDDAYITSLFMNTKLIQGKSHLMEIAKAKKMKRVLNVLDTEFYHSYAHLLGTCKNSKDFQEQFNFFLKDTPQEKIVPTLQQVLYVLIDENNREIFLELIKGYFYNSELFFPQIKLDLFAYALSRETDGEIILDLGFRFSTQELSKAMEMAIQLNPECPGMNSDINSKGADGWTNIPLKNMRNFVMMLFSRDVFSWKIYKILLDKVIRNHDYDLIRIVFNDYREKIPNEK